MSKYGLDFYGPGTYYGNPTTISFDATPFHAESKDYGVIELSWFKPKDDSTGNTSLSTIRLVRNPLGFPEGPMDGTVLFGSIDNPLLLTAATNSFLDTTATAGRYYYYSLFVTNQAGTWYLAGNATGLSVKNFGSTDYLYDNLPTPFKATDLYNWKNNNNQNSQLHRFLSIIGFQMDAYRTDMALLLRPFDMDRIKATIVPVILGQFGYDYEPATSAAFDRRMAQNATFINKMRGTISGIQRYTESFTGWGVRIVPGKNLLLDRNDASAEESIGRWYANNLCELSRRPSDSVVPAVLDPGSPSNFPNRTAAVMQIQVNTSKLANEETWGGSGNYPWGSAGVTWGGKPTSPSTSASFSLPNFRNIKQEGVPVKATLTYAVSVRINRLETDRTVQLTMTWFDEKGFAIGWDAPSESTVTSAWATRLTHVAVAPDRAKFLGLTVAIAGVINGESYFVDTVQVEQAAAVTYYEDPRTANIQLLPVRENLIGTPIFNASVGEWTNTTAASPLTDIAPSPLVGTVLNDSFVNCLRFSEDSAGTKSGTITASYSTYVTSKTGLTFSTYEKAVGATSMTMKLTFSDLSTQSYSATPQLVKTVTNKQVTLNVATLTCANHGYILGDVVFISGVGSGLDTPSLQNTTITAVTTNTFSYRITLGNVTSTACTGSVSKWGRHFVSAVSPVAPTVTLGSITSNVVTLKTSATHGFSVGDIVAVTNTLPSMNGTFTVVSVPTLTTITYARNWGNDVTSTAVNGAVDGLRKVTATVTMVGVPGVVGYLDAAMLEPLGTKFTTLPANNFEFTPGAFLSGRSNYGNASDVIWTGAALASTSAWYPNRVPKYNRLQTTLKNHIPAGADFRLSFASRYGS